MDYIFDIVSLIIWSLAGIIQFIAQKMEIEMEYTTFWICYGCLMISLIRFVF